MFRTIAMFIALAAVLALTACRGGRENDAAMQQNTQPQEQFKYLTEQFADLKILRYRIPGFEQLTPQQKELVYYLYEAGLSGRDMLWDQNCKYNLAVRHTLENIVRTYKGDRESQQWKDFLVYVKRVWFSNGIHHHYSNNKIEPGFLKEYFAELTANSGPAGFPLRDGETVEQLAARLTPVLFDPGVAAKRVNLDPKCDMVQCSANNFYEGVTQQEVEKFYAAKADPKDPAPVSWGLNSKLFKKDGRIEEHVWKIGGMYGPAIEKVVYWLEKAVTVAENESQRKALTALIEYYRTGDLKKFDQYSVLWVEDSTSMVDLINGFIETYGDAMDYRATYESLVYFKDLEATRRMEAIAAQAQWFEDNAPIMDGHKKKKVTGVTGRVITVAGEAGDVSPSTPIGINLPNSNWVRAKHGSKSVTIGNIVNSYNEVNKTSGVLEEFNLKPERIEAQRQWGDLADNLHTDLHEVIGHASGQINPGVGSPRETLKNYSATLEEARADLVALYYLLDSKLVEIGVMPSLEVGRASYDDYLTNGLLVQLARVKPGEQIEEAHMRNRALVCRWVMEKGAPDRIVEKVTQDGKTYYTVNDYDRLRALFGDLLREIQRIKSEGDYAAGQALVENYGVKVDPALHQEVLERYNKLNIAPYSGFINPVLKPVLQDGRMVDVKVEYPEDFMAQMLYYAGNYSFLPVEN